MAFKALEDAIETLKKRMGLVESAQKADASGISTLGEWAAKSGPQSYVSPYKSAWAKGIDSGGSLDAHSAANHIIIGQTGVYEIKAFMRGGTTADYIAIALNGDRTTLENRTAGVWTHDHSGGTNVFSSSYYMGQLTAGELITAGPYTSGTGIQQGPTGTIGMLTIRRIS